MEMKTDIILSPSLDQIHGILIIFRGQHLQSQEHETTLPFYDPVDLFVDLGEFHEEPPSTSGEEVFHDASLASESQVLTSKMSYK